jgi:putative salt-induced outer membrane protein
MNRTGHAPAYVLLPTPPTITAPAVQALSTLLIAGALIAVAAPARAQWTGSGEIGAVSARGNTDSDSANAKLDVANELEYWKHHVYFSSLYGSNNSVTSNNRWETRLQADYKITEPLYWFGAGRYERDHFGSYSYQASLTTGLGYKLIDNDTTKFTVQGGVGIKKAKPQTLVKDEDDSDRVLYRIDEPSEIRGDIVAGAKFEHALTANTKIIDNFLMEATSANTFMQNDLALQVSMNDRFALSVAYGIRQNTSPPPDSEKRDTITTLSVVYKLNK